MANTPLKYMVTKPYYNHPPLIMYFMMEWFKGMKGYCYLLFHIFNRFHIINIFRSFEYYNNPTPSLSIIQHIFIPNHIIKFKRC